MEEGKMNLRKKCGVSISSGLPKETSPSSMKYQPGKFIILLMSSPPSGLTSSLFYFTDDPSFLSSSVGCTLSNVRRRSRRFPLIAWLSGTILSRAIIPISPIRDAILVAHLPKSKEFAPHHPLYPGGRCVKYKSTAHT